MTQTQLKKYLKENDHLITMTQDLGFATVVYMLNDRVEVLHYDI